MCTFDFHLYAGFCCYLSFLVVGVYACRMLVCMSVVRVCVYGAGLFVYGGVRMCRCFGECAWCNCVFCAGVRVQVGSLI